MSYIGQRAAFIILITFVFLFSSIYAETDAEAGQLKGIDSLIIGDGSCSAVVANPGGKIIFSKNLDRQLIPASIIKIFTSLVSMHYLGLDYRFVTEFYLDKDMNLEIIGNGDPMLISEDIDIIAEKLSKKVTTINDIVVNGSYFCEGLKIPGVGRSNDPYNAPNSALSVNFNTVAFKYTDGQYVSGEMQTPLIPFIIKRVKRSRLKEGRIRLKDENESLLYAGHLFKYFLQKNSIEVKGKVRRGTLRNRNIILIHISPYSIKDVLSYMLEYSNNFMANQLILTAGAKAYGPEATLSKGVKVAKTYAEKILKIDDIKIVEGSGISRSNRISAKSMMIILEEFKPYHELIKREHRVFFKTGTLNGIATRAGYIESKKGGFYQFVVMLNSHDNSIFSIMSRLIRLKDA